MSDKNENVAKLIIEYIRIASDMSEDDKRLPWYEIGEVFYNSVVENRIRKNFPILKTVPQNKKQTADPSGFDYPERDWYFWVHTLAKRYGWTISEISNLDPDDALGLLMEIEVSEFDEREFQYKLSEIAYAYDKSSKKSKYIPLQKPRWMQTSKIIEAPKRKIHRSMIPAGVIIKVEHADKDTDN